MLQNRIYLGEIVHREKSYPGQHEAIIAKARWDGVQQLLRENRVERSQEKRVTSPSLLAGLLFDDRGQRMTPSHASKRGTRYRYYVSRSLLSDKRSDASAGRRVPAGDIEELVVRRVREWLSDPQSSVPADDASIVDLSVRKRLMDAARAMAERWLELGPGEQRRMLQVLGVRVELLPKKVEIRLMPSRMPSLLDGDCSDATALLQDSLMLSVPARLKRTGLEMRLLIEGERSHELDASLLKLFIKARALQNLLLSGNKRSVREIARAEGMTGSYATRLLRISFLAPDILAEIVNGRHPPDLNAAKLLRDSRLPLDWKEQRVALGFT
jgi:hypothetical protein